ncbi:DUF2267 domain-containing protein [Streptomyces sp. NPDC006784]|uniref:DUF2267 domain-containing protein n=1 Tax=Streptomyces sp. NPDC006784 TaxID=3364764 RepID=UPI0036B9F881
MSLTQIKPQATPVTEAVTYHRLVERVRYDGAYPTSERADAVIHAVLTSLGRRLPEEERTALADMLPEEAARFLTSTAREPEQFTGWEFVADLASRTGGTPATARWDTGTVLELVARLAGADLVARILEALPAGYALLFGRAELTRPAPAQPAPAPRAA